MKIWIRQIDTVTPLLQLTTSSAIFHCSREMSRKARLSGISIQTVRDVGLHQEEYRSLDTPKLFNDINECSSHRELNGVEDGNTERTSPSHNFSDQNCARVLEVSSSIDRIPSSSCAAMRSENIGMLDANYCEDSCLAWIDVMESVARKRYIVYEGSVKMLHLLEQL